MSPAAKLILLLAVAIAGFAAGVKWHAGQDAIAEQARQVNQRAAERLRRQNTNTAAAVHEVDKVEIRTVFKTITEEVERVVEKPVYRDVCLDADGLRVIQSAIDRVNGTAGQPGHAVPAAAAAP